MAKLDQVIAPYPIVVWDLDHTIASLDVDWEGLKRELASFVKGDSQAPYSELFNQAAATDRGAAFALQAKFEAGAAYTTHRPIVAAIETAAKQHVFALFTDNLTATAERILAELNIRQHFRTLVTKDSIDTWKPSGAGISVIMTTLNDSTPEHFVMVGDSWKDQQAAAEAGILFLDVTPFQE